MSDRSGTLTNAAVHILLAVGPGELHGYAIMAAVQDMTGGATRLAPGTLYVTIKRLLQAGLIEELDERPDPSLDDQRRRYYRLTPAGRAVVADEVRRMDRLTAASRPWLPEARD